jgi:hypothetical protein
MGLFVAGTDALAALPLRHGHVFAAHLHVEHTREMVGPKLKLGPGDSLIVTLANEIERQLARVLANV